MRLKLLSGGAADGLVHALAATFEAESGAGIDGTFAAVGAIRDKLLAGELADMVILSKALITQLAASGHLAAEAADLGVVRTALAVRAGDPLPAIGTPDELLAALLAADAIYTPDPKIATAGNHFVGVLDKLGIKDEVAARLRVFPNGMTAMRAMAGAGDRQPIGCTQMTEIVATPGLALAGPLPKAFELSTVYTAAVVSGSAHEDLARKLMSILSGPEAAGVRRKAGFEAA